MFTVVFGKQVLVLVLLLVWHICAMVSHKSLNARLVLKFECEKDEDNCLIWHIKKGFKA